MATDAAIVLPLSTDAVAQAEQKATGTAEVEGQLRLVRGNAFW